MGAVTYSSRSRPRTSGLGRALDDFAEPQALTVGADDPAAAEAAAAFWAPAGVEVNWSDTATAELSKHLINATLAACTALGNEMPLVAASTGADATLAARLARRDPRLASLPLIPGMLGSAEERSPVMSACWRSAGALIRWRRLWSEPIAGVSRRSLNAWRTSGGPVAVLGLTYKPGTSTLRRSMALELAARLADAGIEVRAHDPRVRADDPALARLRPAQVVGLEAALARAATVVVATAHPEFSTIDADALGGGAVTVIDLVGGLDRTRDWAEIDFRGREPEK